MSIATIDPSEQMASMQKMRSEKAAPVEPSRDDISTFQSLMDGDSVAVNAQEETPYANEDGSFTEAGLAKFQQEMTLSFIRHNMDKNQQMIKELKEG